MIGPFEVGPPSSGYNPDKVIIFGRDQFRPDRVPPAYIFPVIAPIRGNWKKRGTRRRRLFPLSRRGGRRLGVKRDICCEGEFRGIETSTGRRARFEKKPGMDISRGRMGSDVACFVDITYSGDGCFARESRGFTSRRVVNESTLICLPVLTYFFSIIHPSFVQKNQKEHGWKMTQQRIEDTAFSFAPVESRRAGQTNLSWRFFQPIQTSAEATSYLYLAWSRVNSIHPHKAREDWLPFLLDCAGTPLGQRLFG